MPAALRAPSNKVPAEVPAGGSSSLLSPTRATPPTSGRMAEALSSGSVPRRSTPTTSPGSSPIQRAEDQANAAMPIQRAVATPSAVSPALSASGPSASVALSSTSMPLDRAASPALSASGPSASAALGSTAWDNTGGDPAGGNTGWNDSTWGTPTHPAAEPNGAARRVAVTPTAPPLDDAEPRKGPVAKTWVVPHASGEAAPTTPFSPELLFPADGLTRADARTPSAAAPAVPTLRVTIGRIEILPADAAPPSPKARPRAGSSLTDYLAKRRTGGT